MQQFEIWQRNAAILKLRSACVAPPSSLHRLLTGFSNKEISIIAKYPHLVERIGEIAKMSLDELREELEEHFDLEIEACKKEGILVSTEKIGDAVPDWFETPHFGWIFPSIQDVLEWGQGFLMQEVRVNLWLAYLRHKEETAGGTSKTEYEKDSLDVVGHYGPYL